MGGQGWINGGENSIYFYLILPLTLMSSTISLITLCLVLILEAKLTKQNCLRRLNYRLTVSRKLINTFINQLKGFVIIILLCARYLAHFMPVHLPLGVFSIVIFLCGIYVEVLFEDCDQGLKHYAYPICGFRCAFSR